MINFDRVLKAPQKCVFENCDNMCHERSFNKEDKTYFISICDNCFEEFKHKRVNVKYSRNNNLLFVESITHINA